MLLSCADRLPESGQQQQQQQISVGRCSTTETQAGKLGGFGAVFLHFRHRLITAMLLWSYYQQSVWEKFRPESLRFCVPN